MKAKMKTKLLAALLSIVMIFAAIPLSSLTAMAAVTGFRDMVTDGTSYVGYFEVDGNIAYCIQHSITTPGLNSPTGTPVESFNQNLRKVLYYGAHGPDARLGTTDRDWVITTLAASRANGDTAGTIGATVNPFWDLIAGLPDPPSNFHVWTVTTNGGATQDLAYWTIDRKGWAKLVKASANPELTNGNSCYSLAGAVYDVWDNNWTPVGQLVTNEWGETNVLELLAGSYFVKGATC